MPLISITLCSIKWFTKYPKVGFVQKVSVGNMSFGQMLRRPFERLTTKCVQHWSSNMVDRWPAWPIQWSFCFELLLLLLQLQILSTLYSIGSNSTKFFPQAFFKQLKESTTKLNNPNLSFKLSNLFFHMGAGFELVTPECQASLKR